MAGMTVGSRLSGLRIVELVSVLAGVATLVVSSIYLHAVIEIRGDFYKSFCPDRALPPIDDYICDSVLEWWRSGILGVVFSIVQIIVGVAGIILVDSKWKIWTILNTLLFLTMIFTFSWAAKHNVDDKMANLLNSQFNAQVKGQIFLALIGLDFIFLFSSAIFICIFGRRIATE